MTDTEDAVEHLTGNLGTAVLFASAGWVGGVIHGPIGMWPYVGATVGIVLLVVSIGVGYTKTEIDDPYV